MSQPDSVATSPAQPANKARRTFLAIVAVALLPMAAAYFMFFTGIGVPAHTVNNGLLLSEPLSIASLLGAEHPLVKDFEAHKKWRLLLPLGESCSVDCASNLYTTRQVHIRLGEKSDRVERVAVNLGGAAGEALFAGLQPEHPRLRRMDVAPTQWRAWLENARPAVDVGDDVYLLVDQEGFAMMVYTANIDGKLLLKDLKHALKFSIDYQ